MKNCLIYTKKILLFFVIIILTNCGGDNQKIPYEYVDISIDLNVPEFSDLNQIGSYVMITGGVSGIIIYHESSNIFHSYDRCCPYDPYCDRVRYNEENENLRDTCCGSEFSLKLGGIVSKGPANISLREYKTTYNEFTNKLRIVN